MKKTTANQPPQRQVRPARAFVLMLTAAGRGSCQYPSSFVAGDAYEAVCVIERGPKAARKMAATAARDEGAAVWLDPTLSTCVEVRETDVPRVLVVGSPITTVQPPKVR